MSHSRSTIQGAFVRMPVGFLCGEPVLQASQRTSLTDLSLSKAFMKRISQILESQRFSIEK